MHISLGTTEHGDTLTRGPYIAPGRQNQYPREGHNKIFPSEAGFRNYQCNLSSNAGQCSRSDSLVDSLTSLIA